MRSLDRPSPAPCYVLLWVLFVGLLAPPLDSLSFRFESGTQSIGPETVRVRAVTAAAS
jgi:hypothetical protein